MQHVEFNDRVFRQWMVFGTAEPRIDVTGRLLTVTDCGRHRPLTWHHVAAGENAGMSGHHTGTDNHGSVLLEFDAGDPRQESAVGLLTECKHDCVRFELLELSRRPRTAV